MALEWIPPDEAVGGAVDEVQPVKVVEPWERVRPAERAAVEALRPVLDGLVRDAEDWEIYRVRWRRLREGMELLPVELVRELAAVSMSIAWNVSDEAGKAELLRRVGRE